MIIAGSDSSGGAGIQADIKTVTSLGSYAMTAITAVTVQNTMGVKSVISIPTNEVKNQIIYSSRDIRPDAIKIGMLHSTEVVEKVAHALRILKVKKIILDPVMVAKGGTKLIDSKAIQTLKKKLLKNVLLITPNIPEAEVLTNTKINSTDDMIYAANILLNQGAKNILVKGGHLNTTLMQDIFVNKNEIKIFKNKKITTKNTHGTGCTLSSAITTFYSCGKTLKKSCELATKYVNNSIRSNLNYGKGHGPINHLSSIRIKKEFR